MIAFDVLGVPGPQGSKRHVGGGRMIESSKKVKPWREAVRWSAIEARGATEPMQGPLTVALIFTLPKPASAPKRTQTWPMRKPDIDKLVRSTFDALTEAGVWVDDAQVVDLTTCKRYPGEGFGALPSPGVRVTIIPGVRAR